ncbi:uncharacterized protein zgc:193726 isoform X1 [Acanthochromis polyacanthus]|uniref:uncharacterized protein zgc:193726 isoform X1 n=1 Tax=Acanthochromis polyacanthus TaxID=80966 RepID=UPI0022345102|nr:uncharacterized protein zgc:193726 isoform X1 [Acanthochromis polyacanthus]
MTTMMVMVMTMVVCVSAASLGGCRRDDVKVEGSHPENVSTSLKSHQDANETLDVSTRVDSHLNVNKTLEDSARITINQDVNRTMGDSKQDVTLNLPINETSITPLMFDQQQQNRTEDESHERKGVQHPTGAAAKRFGLAPPKACQLSICAVMNLGHELQSGGDELAGQSSSDPFGHGK